MPTTSASSYVSGTAFTVTFDTKSRHVTSAPFVAASSACTSPARFSTCTTLRPVPSMVDTAVVTAVGFTSPDNDSVPADAAMPSIAALTAISDGASAPTDGTTASTGANAPRRLGNTVKKPEACEAAAVAVATSRLSDCSAATAHAGHAT